MYLSTSYLWDWKIFLIAILFFILTFSSSKVSSNPSVLFWSLSCLIARLFAFPIDALAALVKRVILQCRSNIALFLLFYWNITRTFCCYFHFNIWGLLFASYIFVIFCVDWAPTKFEELSCLVVSMLGFSLRRAFILGDFKFNNSLSSLLLFLSCHENIGFNLDSGYSSSDWISSLSKLWISFTAVYSLRSSLLLLRSEFKACSAAGFELTQSVVTELKFGLEFIFEPLFLTE